MTTIVYAGTKHTITLTSGGHSPNDDGKWCLMEAVAYVAGEPWSEAPECVSRVLGVFGRNLNDVLPDEKRQRLVPLIPRLIGTRGDGHDQARGLMAADWLIRTYTPTWLRLAGLTDAAVSLETLPRQATWDDVEAATPASVRFVSCEPLLGPVDLTYVQIIAPDPTYGPGLWLDALRGHYIGPDDITDDRIHWVIAGGESGHGARPAHPDWFRSIRDQCLGAGVAFHFKQWGEWQNGSHDPRTQHGPDHIVHRNGEHVLASEYAGSDIVTGPSERRRGACFMSRVGKKVAGRELDGREWSEYPEVVS